MYWKFIVFSCRQLQHFIGATQNIFTGILNRNVVDKKNVSGLENN